MRATPSTEDLAAAAAVVVSIVPVEQHIRRTGGTRHLWDVVADLGDGQDPAQLARFTTKRAAHDYDPIPLIAEMVRNERTGL